MKRFLFLLFLLGTTTISYSQIILEYTNGINHEGVNVTTDIRITITDTKIKIEYSMPKTNFTEIYLVKNYNIIKYAGKMEEDEKGYHAFVWEVENNLIFSHMYKLEKDHWCMLSDTNSDGHTIFQIPL